MVITVGKAGQRSEDSKDSCFFVNELVVSPRNGSGPIQPLPNQLTQSSEYCCKDFDTFISKLDLEFLIQAVRSRVVGLRLTM